MALEDVDVAVVVAALVVAIVVAIVVAVVAVVVAVVAVVAVDLIVVDQLDVDLAYDPKHFDQVLTIFGYQ